MVEAVKGGGLLPTEHATVSAGYRVVVREGEGRTERRGSYLLVVIMMIVIRDVLDLL